MVDFIEKQIAASERLYNMMMQDHKERMKEIAVWGDMNAGLISKLEQRDAEIVNLRNRVQLLEQELSKK